MEAPIRREQGPGLSALDSKHIKHLQEIAFHLADHLFLEPPHVKTGMAFFDGIPIDKRAAHGKDDKGEHEKGKAVTLDGSGRNHVLEFRQE